MKKIFCTSIVISILTHSVFAQNVPNDPYYNLSQDSQWTLKKIGLPAVWNEFTTGGLTAAGDTIVVAIIDAGFDLNHEDLKANFCTGWNAFDPTAPIPVNYHGTVISGIIGAVGNNNKGVCGINWNVKMLPIYGMSDNLVVVRRAVNHIIEMRQMYNESNGQKGAFIVAANFSFGPSTDRYSGIYSSYSDDDFIGLFSEWSAMFKDLGNVGILSCQPAGSGENIDNLKFYIPLDFTDQHIFVATTLDDDVIDENLSYGAKLVDIGAPVASPVMNFYSTDINNAYTKNNSAPSWTAPHVAGVIALMYAAMPPSMIQTAKSDPANFAKSVKQALLNGADTFPALKPFINSGRRLNAYKAVQEVAGCPRIANIANQIITTNTTVINNAKLILDAVGEVNIIKNFEVELGSEFEIK